MKRLFTVILISLISAGSVLADTVFSKDGSSVRFISDDGAVLELIIWLKQDTLCFL